MDLRSVGISRLVGISLVAGLLVTACSGGTPAAPEPSPCGWDLTSEAGRAANQERLTFLSQWLIDNPGVVAPSPTSSYWHGECPVTATPGPPEDEDEHPDQS